MLVHYQLQYVHVSNITAFLNLVETGHYIGKLTDA